jgi:phosphoribosylaminoimidazole-succinocarboxamide synthase
VTGLVHLAAGKVRDMYAVPPIPPEIVEQTRARYVEAYERITGLSFADWPGGEGA